MDLGLAGRRALVTGASGGIGFECARSLAAEGCDVALVGRDVHRLKAAMKAIRADFRVGVTSHATDLSIPSRIDALVDVVGSVDILVNCAGSVSPGDLDSLGDHHWAESWDAKLFAAIALAKLILPQMRARQAGVIVNVAGVNAVRPRADEIAESAGNAALVAFTRAVGSTSLRDGVRVVAVNPGLIETARMEEVLRHRAERRFANPERWEELIPYDPGPGLPSDVADLVAFLASDRAGHISGTAITVDGGASTA